MIILGGGYTQGVHKVCVCAVENHMIGGATCG